MTTGAARRVAVVFGTRPEAIKLAPVVRALKESRAARYFSRVTAWKKFGYNIDGKATVASSSDVCSLAMGAPQARADCPGQWLPLGVTPRNILHASRRRNDGLAPPFYRPSRSEGR
jgi:hypothetical protein